MNCREVLGILIIIAVISSGCIGNPLAGNQSAKTPAASSMVIGETPTLPDEYSAKSVNNNNVASITGPATTAPREKPVIESEAKTTITPSSLTGNGNDTPALVLQYLSENQTNSNQSAILAEKAFWNQVAGEIELRIDGGNPVVRDFALNAISPTHSGTYNIDQVCDIWDNVTPQWTYVSDPNNPVGQFWDYLAFASESITVGLKGDCDDYAILNAALVEAIGGNSRVVYAANPTDGAHMYAEAQFADTSFVPEIQSRYTFNGTVYYHPGNWLNLDWFDYPKNATHPGGNYFADSGVIWTIYKDGHWEKLQNSSAGWTIILNGP